MPSDYQKGVWLTTLGVIALSFDALLIRLVNSDEFSLLFWRGLLLSLMVCLWLKLNKKNLVVKPDLAYYRSSLLFTLSSVCFVAAIHHTTAANVLVIISAQPVFSALIAQVVLKEKSPPITWLAILFCFGGIAWVMQSSWSNSHLYGDLLALACSFCLAAKFVNDRAVSHRDMSPALISSGILICLIGFIWGEPFSMEGAQWGWMVLLCAFIIPLAFVLITLGPTRIPAAEVGMLMLLETVLGPLLVWMFLAEAPSKATLQGGTLVIITLVIHSWFRYRSTNHTTPSAP